MSQSSEPQYDALLVVSFGGPEGPNDVMPFLENVLRGRNVPRERMLEVSEHYQHFGGVSPINAQNRALIEAVEADLKSNGVEIPIYWGNRNWHPMLNDTIQQMKSDGVKRAIAFVTSAFSSYSGCRQYRENIQHSLESVGATDIVVDKLRVFYNHPLYVDVMAERTRDALSQIPEAERDATLLVFTAHSIPNGMASNCRYELQLNESSRLVAAAVGSNPWKLVYQSRSGPPTQPWLEPDICDYLQEVVDAKEHKNVVVIPIGFISDHMEVLFDLDTEAKELCEKHGLNMVRAATAGTHPKFVTMIRDVIEERLFDKSERAATGEHPASHDVCPEDCCLSGRPPAGAGRPR